MTMPAVEFSHVDILFGRDGKRDKASLATAAAMLDQGRTRTEILDKLGVVVGVADATLSVERGEICVLMGLSGSGKSTLLRAVNGLNKVARGKVLVENDGAAVDIGSCSPTMLRTMRTRRIAMVFQQFALLPWRTVRENVGFGLELRGVSAAERRRVVDEKLKLVALDQWADRYANQLSGGMQQRVGLARAFATDADILLMDEPFSALDPLIRTKLQDELLALQRQVHKTIIFVSHDLDEALKIGNRIAIMESGRVVQWGTPEDIVLNPANDYVAEFVQHMNPLNVLRGRSVMVPAAQLRRDGATILLDDEGALRLSLDAAGGISGFHAKGDPCRIAPLGTAAADLALGDVAIASADQLLRDVIALRRHTRRPVVLVDEGRVVGICGEEEILASFSPETRRSA
nr:choline ABC transporter ATP-binding protein [Segnochrobactrum spirostomi]